MKNHRLLIVIGFLMGVACATIPTKPVSFLAIPNTSGELTVARAVAACLTAFNEGNIDKHIGFYAAEAKIESVQTKKVLSREEYLAKLQSLGPKLGKLELTEAKIGILSPDRSQVEGKLGIRQNSDTTIRPISYDLIRHEDQWLIVEQKFPAKQ